MYYSFIRLILFPLLVLAAAVPLKLDPLSAGIAVVMSGMPAPATLSIMTDKYGGDRDLAACLVFVSTLASLATVPCLVWLLNRLFQT
jgi:predicted permease